MSHPDLPSFAWTGSGLQRPECVLATASGNLYVADWRGGVTRIRPDGGQATYLAPEVDGIRLQPNGIALQPDGSFLIAHLGADTGGVFRLDRTGNATPLLTRVDGVDLPPTNFVLPDAQGRLWVTVSTRLSPRARGYRRDVADGFVVLVDPRGARIVADGLGYTNECVLDAQGQYLYVNETFGRRLSRFRVEPSGGLGPRETVTEFGPGTFPDGLALDVEGYFWVTSIVSNRVIRVAPDGGQKILFDDCDADALRETERAYEEGRMGREHLDRIDATRTLRNISSLAFGGADLRTGYLGCLLGDRLATLAMPVAGHPPVHWNWG